MSEDPSITCSLNPVATDPQSGERESYTIVDEQRALKQSFTETISGRFEGLACEPVCDSLSAAKRLLFPLAALCTILLTILAFCYTLFFCKPVFLPVAGAFLLNFVLSPVVYKLKRIGIPTFLGTLIVIGLAIGMVAGALAFAYSPAKSWIADKDKNIATIQKKLMTLQRPLAAVQEVSEEIDRITSGATRETGDLKTTADPDEKSDMNSRAKAGDGADPRARDRSNSAEPANTAHSFVEHRAGTSTDSEGSDSSDADSELPMCDGHKATAIPVQVAEPSISNRIFSTTGDTLAGLSVMLVVLFYLLSAGDRGLEKLVKLMPTFRDKKRIVELTRAIERSISIYLTTTTMINAGLGIVIGTGMWVMGMPNPILWGIMAMLLNYFPFIGAMFGAMVVFLAAVVSFDSLAYAAWAPAIYLVANLVEANLITPVLLGHSVSLHPVWLMIFFVIVSWVWGLGGAIVAVPILAVIKISCDHIEPLGPIGEFLGR